MVTIVYSKCTIYRLTSDVIAKKWPTFTVFFRLKILSTKSCWGRWRALWFVMGRTLYWWLWLTPHCRRQTTVTSPLPKLANWQKKAEITRRIPPPFASARQNLLEEFPPLLPRTARARLRIRVQGRRVGVKNLLALPSWQKYEAFQGHAKTHVPSRAN